MQNTSAEVLCGLIWRWYHHEIILSLSFPETWWLQKKTKKSTYTAAKEGIGSQGYSLKRKGWRVYLSSNRQYLNSSWHISLWTRCSCLTVQFYYHCQCGLPDNPAVTSEKSEFPQGKNDNAKCHVTHVTIIKGTRVPPSGLGKYYLWWQKISQKKKK